MSQGDRNALTLNVQMKSNISNPRLQSLRSINNPAKNMDDKSSHQHTVKARVSGKLGEESKHASAPQLDEPDFDRDQIMPALSEVTNQRRRANGFTEGKPANHNHDSGAQMPQAKAHAIKTERGGSKTKAHGADSALDGQHSFESKVPESLHEKQQSPHPRRKNDLIDSGKPLNDDIPVDKKPRKSKVRRTHKVGGASRVNQILEGLTPSIQLYSPSPPIRQGSISAARMTKGQKLRHSVKASRNAMNRLQQNSQDDNSQTRTGQMVIDLQIKPEKQHVFTRNANGGNGADTRKRKNETASDAAITPHGITDESPQIRTVENSQVGEGLNNLRQGGNEEDADQVVIFHEEKPQEVPHTADNDGRRHVKKLGDFDEEERPGRERRKRFDRFATVGSASPARSMEDDGRDGHYGGDSGRFNSLILAKRIKNENSRMLQSLETRFSILQRNEQRVLKRIEGQRQRAEQLMEIRDHRERERKAVLKLSQLRHSAIQAQKLENFKAKEGQRLNLSIVHQSMMLNKKLNHLEIRRERSERAREICGQKSRESSAKKERSESMKKIREQAIQAKYYALQQKDLERKDTHMNKVINEFKTAQMQAKVIKSLSNIENLMVNKLNNTSQKLSVLQTSDKHDVIEFLGMDRNSSRKKNRSGSKFRNRLKNIHSIDGTVNEQIGPRNPPMQFVDRSSTNDGWHRRPKATLMSQSIDVDMPNRRKHSRSKSKGPKNLAYVSIMSAPRSRSKSTNKSPRFRSTSVKSGRKRSKTKQFKKLFEKQSMEQHSKSPFNDSIDILNESSVMPAFTVTNMSVDRSISIADQPSQLPPKRIIKVKKKKKRVIRNGPTKLMKSLDEPADGLQFMPQPQMQSIQAQSPEDQTLVQTLSQAQDSGLSNHQFVQQV